MTDDTLHPPKPVMAFRVGVTGHRKSRLAGQRERIEAQVETALAAVSEGLRRAHEKYVVDYADGPPVRYFVSCLADGADTFAAEKALDDGWLLLAPLPFSAQVYGGDFAPEDREEFDAILARAHAAAELDGKHCDLADKDRAYLQAGVVTVDQSDFIIAVWDGEEARGVGGTAMIKEEALAAGKPVVWINALSDKPMTVLTRRAGETAFSDTFIYETVDAIIAPPAAGEIESAYSEKSTHARSAYRAYARERAHRFNYGSFFQFWEKAFAGRWPFAVGLTCPSPAEEIEAARKSTLAQKLKASDYDQRVFNELIIPRFAWADHLAVHYGNLYRSSYFFNYLFAAVAVFLALFDLVASGYGFGNKTIWIGLEVTIIALIMTVTGLGWRGRWHKKWIDYRQLAEELRQYRLSYLTLGRDARGEDVYAGQDAEPAGWVEWYFNAVQREAGMTSAAFAPGSIAVIAKTILEEEVRPQIVYHERKAKTLHAMEHRLHRLGEYAFGATLLACLVYLGLAFASGDGKAGLQYWAKTAKEEIKGLVTLMTAFFPALGAGFFGIRVQGEFGSTAERSHATAAQLGAIAQKLERLAAADEPRLETLRRRVAEAARAMLMENMDWRQLYISKPLNLPG